jgi:hypothetical protein
MLASLADLSLSSHHAGVWACLHCMHASNLAYYVLFEARHLLACEPQVPRCPAQVPLHPDTAFRLQTKYCITVVGSLTYYDSANYPRSF